MPRLKLLLGYKEYLQILVTFIVTRIALTATALISVVFISPKHPKLFEYHRLKWLDIWALNDSGWYIDIARNGYSSEPLEWLYNQSNIGFFPLLPKSIAALNLFTHNSVVSGVVLSNFCAVAGCFYLYELSKILFPTANAHAVARCFLLLPASFTLSTLLAEPMLFLFFTAAFYYAYKSNYLLSAIAGALATLTKPSGILIGVSLLIIIIQRGRFLDWRALLPLILLPLALAGFGLYCQLYHHDFLAYVHSKKIGWQTYFMWPWQSLLLALKSTNPVSVIGAIYACVLLGILIVFRRIPLSLWVFGLLQILFPIMNGYGNLVCMIRYSAVLFPLAFIFCRIKMPEAVKTCALVIFALLQLLCMISFANGFDYVA